MGRTLWWELALEMHGFGPSSVVGAGLKNAWVWGVRILSLPLLSRSSVQHISALVPTHSWDLVALHTFWARGQKGRGNESW